MHRKGNLKKKVLVLHTLGEVFSVLKCGGEVVGGGGGIEKRRWVGNLERGPPLHHLSTRPTILSPT